MTKTEDESGSGNVDIFTNFETHKVQSKDVILPQNICFLRILPKQCSDQGDPQMHSCMCLQKHNAEKRHDTVSKSNVYSISIRYITHILYISDFGHWYED